MHLFSLKNDALAEELELSSKQNQELRQELEDVRAHLCKSKQELGAVQSQLVLRENELESLSQALSGFQAAAGGFAMESGNFDKLLVEDIVLAYFSCYILTNNTCVT